MKKVTFYVVALAIILAAAAPASAQPCQPTGFQGLTAALINPGDLNGNVVNASGCDIGVYYGAGAEATVKSVTITSAKRFGILVNGDAGAAAVDVLDSQISQIGDPGFSGNQYGVAIYYRAFFATGSATGRVSGNTITQYQKGGVVVNGPGSNVQVQDNVVEGLGTVSFIAQNGIQFGWGGGGSAMRNRVSGNQYTGSSTFSGGIIVVGGPGWGLAPDGNPYAYSTGIQIVKNVLENNDVGVALENYAAGFAAPDEPTNNKVVNNTITNDAMTNGYPYQVGVADVGNNDKIISNTISGAGYPVAVDADPSFTNRPKVHANR